METFSVITVDPQGALDLHDRMPVILAPEAYGEWLDPRSGAKTILDLLRPVGAEQLVLTAVSDRVNSVVNDDPRCAAPAAVQTSLF